MSDKIAFPSDMPRGVRGVAPPEDNSNGPVLRHLLPTTVVGSYSVPEWLERLKTECYQRRISAAHLAEIHEVAIKAAIKDQEQAGIDIVSDGELRRDNDIDYFLARIPGVLIERRAKADYYDYYDAEVAAALPDDSKATLGLADDYRFTARLTARPVKFSFTGPFSLSRRISGAGYPDPAELVRALARRLNRRRGRWRRRAPASSRSTSRSWRAIRTRRRWRWRRLTS